MTDTYDVRLMDRDVSAGDTAIAARSLDDAISQATAWAQGGDWDHPGSVRVVLSRDGADVWEQEVEVG